MEMGAASRPKPGEIESGDLYAYWDREDGRVVAVIDGLGHGPHAARAAIEARRFIEEDLSLCPEGILRRCDEKMRGTRGAAITIVSIQASGRLVHAGVGNVSLVTRARVPIHAVSSPGIIGARTIRIRQTGHALNPGDLLVLYTDGVSSRFNLQDYVHLEPQQMAEAMLANHGKDHDDATCVVIRY